MFVKTSSKTEDIQDPSSKLQNEKYHNYFDILQLTMNLKIQLASLDFDIKILFQLIMWKTDCLRPQISEHPTLFLSICSETQH